MEQTVDYSAVNLLDDERTGKPEADRTRMVNYRKIVVADDLENSAGFSSEFRGKVQNRNVDVRYLSSYRLSYFRPSEQIDRRINYSPLLELESWANLWIDCSQLR